MVEQPEIDCEEIREKTPFLAVFADLGFLKLEFPRSQCEIFVLYIKELVCSKCEESLSLRGFKNTPLPGSARCEETHSDLFQNWKNRLSPVFHLSGTGQTEFRKMDRGYMANSSPR
jgi:hypothetical protein